MWQVTSRNSVMRIPLGALRTLIDSAPSLGVYCFFVVDSFCLSVSLYLRLSVRLSRTNFKWLLLFCFSMESSHLFAVCSPCDKLQKCFSSIFDLGPLTPKIDSPKFKFSQNCLQLGLYGTQTADVCTYQVVFWDGRLNGTMYNVVGPTLVAMATKFGLGAESSRLPAC